MLFRYCLLFICAAALDVHQKHAVDKDKLPAFMEDMKGFVMNDMKGFFTGNTTSPTTTTLGFYASQKKAVDEDPNQGILADMKNFFVRPSTTALPMKQAPFEVKMPVLKDEYNLFSPLNRDIVKVRGKNFLEASVDREEKLEKLEKAKKLVETTEAHEATKKELLAAAREKAKAAYDATEPNTVSSLPESAAVKRARNALIAAHNTHHQALALHEKLDSEYHEADDTRRNLMREWMFGDTRFQSQLGQMRKDFEEVEAEEADLEGDVEKLYNKFYEIKDKAKAAKKKALELEEIYHEKLAALSKPQALAVRLGI